MRRLLLLLFVVNVYGKCTVDRCISIVPYFTCTVCVFENITRGANVTLDEGRYIVASINSGDLSVFKSDTIDNHKPQVVNVNVNNTGLERIDKGAFTNFTGLKMVNLVNNRMLKIENGTLNNLSTLIVFNASYNLIEDIELGAFEGLTRIETLDLSYNNLRKLNEAFNSLTTLIYLKLSGNKLKTPDVPKALTRLQTIDFARNDITFVQAQYFVNCTRLTGLFLQNNKISLVMPGSFSNLTNLKYIDLSDNYIDVLDKNLFYTLVYLEKLNLSSNHLSCSSKNLSLSSSKITIALNNNKFINDCVMFKNVNKIQTLSYQSNQIASLDKDSFNQSPNIVSLDLSHNLIKRIPTAYFSHQRQLKYLNLSNNSLANLQIGSLLGLERLEELNLSNNKLLLVAEIVFHNTPQLQRLDISNNKIETIDATGIVQITDLVRIDIHNNAIKCFQLSDIVRRFKSARVNVVYGPETQKNGVHGIFCDDTIEDFDLFSNGGANIKSNKFDVKMDGIQNDLQKIINELSTTKYSIILLFILLVQILMLILVMFVVYVKYCAVMKIKYGRVEKNGVIYEEETIM